MIPLGKKDLDHVDEMPVACHSAIYVNLHFIIDIRMEPYTFRIPMNGTGNQAFISKLPMK